MNKVAIFQKVSYEQFRKDVQKCLSITDDVYSRFIYNNIKLPKRATVGSAGYDFYAPIDIELKPGETILVPTGIKCRIDEGYVLMLYPRSSMGFKYRMQLDNTVGVIDSDYYHANNEGHIMAKFTNDTNENKTLHIYQGQGMMQGIFTPFAIAYDDDVTAQRVGGIGSTTNTQNTQELRANEGDLS